jgi:hypothetical protein
VSDTRRYVRWGTGGIGRMTRSGDLERPGELDDCFGRECESVRSLLDSGHNEGPFDGRKAKCCEGASFCFRETDTTEVAFENSEPRIEDSGDCR